MDFKGYLDVDLDAVFFNIGEFAESATIDGRVLDVVIDNDKLSERTQKEYDGIYVGDLLYYVRSKDYGAMPKVDELQIFNRKAYSIFDVKNSKGIYEIILRINGN